MAFLNNREKRSFSKMSNYEYTSQKRDRKERNKLKIELDEIAFKIHEFKQTDNEEYKEEIESCIRNYNSLVADNNFWVTYNNII